VHYSRVFDTVDVQRLTLALPYLALPCPYDCPTSPKRMPLTVGLCLVCLQLVELQKLMADGDPRAIKVYEALGIEFGYTLAHFAEFYDYSSLLIMGRVTSGPGGQVRKKRPLFCLWPLFMLKMPSFTTTGSGQT
jgi:hypothetical protein